VGLSDKNVHRQIKYMEGKGAFIFLKMALYPQQSCDQFLSVSTPDRLSEYAMITKDSIVPYNLKVYHTAGTKIT